MAVSLSNGTSRNTGVHLPDYLYDGRRSLPRREKYTLDAGKLAAYTLVSFDCIAHPDTCTCTRYAYIWMAGRCLHRCLRSESTGACIKFPTTRPLDDFPSRRIGQPVFSRLTRNLFVLVVSNIFQILLFYSPLSLFLRVSGAVS